MPTAYVYSPVDGIITGRNQYCGQPCDNNPCTGDHGTHRTCNNWSSPVDIDAVDNEQLYLYVNTAVISIRTFVQYKCCCSHQNDYGRVIIVELYGERDAQCYIGSVLYGHIANPQVTDGQIYNLSGTSKLLGNAPAGAHNCGGFTCYSGSHSHMERSGGATLAPCCCTDTLKGSTAIYKWDFTIPCPGAPVP